jgi:hypothetical protein
MNHKFRTALFAGLILAAFGMAPQAYAEHCTTNPVNADPDGPGGVDTTSPVHPFVTDSFDNEMPVTCDAFIAPILVNARSGPRCEDFVGIIDTLKSPVIELKVVGSISGTHSNKPNDLPMVYLEAAKNSSGTPDSIIIGWEDMTDPGAGQAFELPGQELVFVRAGTDGYAYAGFDMLEGLGLIAPPDDDGNLRTINEVLFCASGALCPLSQEYLVNELGPALNPNLKFPVTLDKKFCDPSGPDPEIPECCNSGDPVFGECTVMDHPDFVVQYVIGNVIGGSTNFVCGIPPLAATRAAEISGDAFFSLAGSATVTTKVNPRRDSVSSTDTTTTTDTSSGGTDSETEYSVGCPFDDPRLCR